MDSVVLRLERISPYGAMSRSLRMALGVDRLHMFKPRGWVAEILPGFQRRFVDGFDDYQHANSRGTRGIYAYYVLHPGRIYEVSHPRNWSKTDRYFCEVVNQEIVQLDRQEVDERLSRSTRKPTPLPAPRLHPKEKRPLGIDVYEAAMQRINWVFDSFPRICVSFSGGKDSSAMLHMVMEVAAQRQRKVGVLFIDLEAQYKLTIDFIQAMYERYADYIEPYWVALPISLRNAVSQYEPKWTCWGTGEEWVRKPPKIAITDQHKFPFYRYGMEFEEFTPEFARWYGQGQLTASLVGIRTDESLNRWRALKMDKHQYEDKKWTTWTGEGTYNVYPIYDWRTSDIWTYHAKFQKPYNPLYDRMHQAGLTIHQMRICQPYGDDQRKGLWLFQVLEPETWAKIVARVNGANYGALYAKDAGNILGNLKIAKPEGHTWESFAKMLLASMPDRTREHYVNKIGVFLKWWSERGYTDGIPDVMPASEENAPSGHRKPSWRRICKVLLKNDYWCKGLSFTQTKSESYQRYLKIMRRRMQQWGYVNSALRL